ncbi:hypothetical protein Ami103574_02625 [Aminipila butyrica]|uniref:D-alanyl-D-alanine carboxypeptidase-like core domain-containing protein n=1 Tax=Aminipila butyrica TaxID=433296 RepID=A0A858BU21_9FIRM|nr:M15 family metallopeptidase [Aminipila butyrica]QIB68274.1 hypothetical protein Ami103574_02625 [Aminipila butyrica]
MMVLISQLKESYLTADPAIWLTGLCEGIDPVLAGRLAYVAQTTGIKIKITEGYRSTARQTELYNQYLEYKRTGKGSIKSAAKPGTSWHEYRLAVDTSTQPIRGWTDAMLHKYGLCKPIASEGWHIQPIETKGQTDRVKFQPEEQEEEDVTETRVREIIKEMLAGSGDTPSSWASEAWEKAKKDGITDGKKPQGYATREQVIIMLDRR